MEYLGLCFCLSSGFSHNSRHYRKHRHHQHHRHRQHSHPAFTWLAFYFVYRFFHSFVVEHRAQFEWHSPIQCQCFSTTSHRWWVTIDSRTNISHTMRCLHRKPDWKACFIFLMVFVENADKWFEAFAQSKCNWNSICILRKELSWGTEGAKIQL